MLLWLRTIPKRLSKRSELFIKLIGIVCIAHIVVLVLLMLSCSVSNTHQIIIGRAPLAQEVTFVVLPFFKTIAQTDQPSPQLKQSPIQPKNMVLKPQKKEAQSQPRLEKKKGTILQSNKKIAKKQNHDRKTQKAKPKKIVPKKNEQKKKKKVDTNKNEEKKQEVPSKNVTHQPKKEPVKTIANVSAKTNESSAIRYIGREDAAQRYVESSLRISLEPHFKPPKGLGALTCILSFEITPQGSVKDVRVNTSSGVLAFDIAAKAAVLQARFAQPTHGKKFEHIEFCA